MKNTIRIKVCGKTYNVVSEETPVYTEKLAASLDSKINSILKASPSLSITDAAVLASLEAYDELSKARVNIENIRSQIKGYVDEAARAKSLDPSVAADANRVMNAAHGRFPTKEDLFFNGGSAGGSVAVGGWIGGSATVRTR